MTQPSGQPQSVVTLKQYAFAGQGTNGPAPPWREWLLVDEHEHVVRTFAADRNAAVDDINARFDSDPSLVERLRLVVLQHGRVTFDEWPRGGSPAERAGALAKTLSGRSDVGDEEVAEWTRDHFLRGELGWTHIAGERRRSVELWWYLPDGEHEPVGLLVDRAEEGAWQLLLDGRSRGLADWQLYRRIAQAMVELADERWTEERVQQLADDFLRGRSETERFGPAGVCVAAQLLLAQQLHIQEPLGKSWP